MKQTNWPFVLYESSSDALKIQDMYYFPTELTVQSATASHAQSAWLTERQPNVELKGIPIKGTRPFRTGLSGSRLPDLVRLVSTMISTTQDPFVRPIPELCSDHWITQRASDTF
jgi:hypothetical protein